MERFIREAADDPQTVSIKMTVYRVGDDTPFVQSLIRAAEAGKQVACVIELNARFDEERNLHWSRELEKVGAHVVFGVSGLKTHSKAALVIRQEESGIRAYAHIGTGNYHARTARLYEDVGLLTADPAVTRDVVTLFHFLTGRSRTPTFEKLVVAPMTMRAEFVRLIEREIANHEAGRPARIVAKLNQLEDPEICALLSRASQAGVPVELIVRGLCCLAPGVPGLTENMRDPLDRRPLPRALPDLPLRRGLRRSARRGVPDRLGRLDDAEPLEARRGSGADLRAPPARAALGDSRDLPRRHAQRLADAAGRPLPPAPAPDGDGPGSEGTHETLMRLARAGHAV